MSSCSPLANDTLCVSVAPVYLMIEERAALSRVAKERIAANNIAIEERCLGIKR